jgi:hypothetical protein
MKKAIVLSLLLIICAFQMMAQKETKNFSVGFGLETGLPVGSYSSIYQFDAGITIRFSYHVGPGFVCLTSGVLALDPKKVVGQKEKPGLEIPVRFGYKYIIHHHFFVLGELGFASTRSYYGSDGKLLSTSEGSFIAAASVGFQWNAFEISLRYDANFKDQGGLLGPRIGFNF